MSTMPNHRSDVLYEALGYRPSKYSNVTSPLKITPSACFVMILVIVFFMGALVVFALFQGRKSAC